MGISFKLAKAGKRYRPKFSQLPTDDISDEKSPAPRDDVEPPGPNPTQDDPVGATEVTGVSIVSPEYGVSFSLNLFPDGFSIGKPTEGMVLPFHQDALKLLHPYDRESDALFSAIEYGWLPGDVFDDIPCKYHNGSIICEVLDYRNCMPKSGVAVSSGEKLPIVQKVRLQMCTENVVKDMPSISDDSWTYHDLLEAESRILKALQPDLCLDPNLSVKKVFRTPVSKKLNLGIGGLKRKIKQSDILARNAPPNNLSNGYSIVSNGMIENKRPQMYVQSDGAVLGAQHCITNISTTNIQHDSIRQDALRRALLMRPQPNYQLAVSRSQYVSSTTSEQDLTNSRAEPRNPGTCLPEKRDRCEVQPTSIHTLKKPKQEPLDMVQQVGSHPGVLGNDLQLKRALLQQQLEAERMQRARFVGQKHNQGMMNDDFQAILEGVPGMEARTPYMDPRGMGYVKDKLTNVAIPNKTGVDNSKDGHHVTDIDSNPAQQLQHLSSFMHSHFPHSMQWSNMGQSIEDVQRDNVSQKRKSSQSPQASSGRRVRSPVSSKSGEVSSYSVGAPHGTRLSTSAAGIHKAMSVPAVGTVSITSGQGDSLLTEIKDPVPTKRKSTSLPRTPTASGVGSPASVSNTNAPFNTNSPIGTPPLLPHPGPNEDLNIVQRFSKIEMVTKRHKLDYTSHKVDRLLERKMLSHSPQMLLRQLSLNEDSEESKDSTCMMPLSKSLVGGSINTSKTRILTFIRTGRIFQGNRTPVLVREGQRLVMSETPNGTVEAHEIYLDEEESDPLAFPQAYLPPLPNTHHADLFAAQFSSLMMRTGYQLIDDQIQPVPVCKYGASTNEAAFMAAIRGVGESDLPYPTPTVGRPLNPATPINNSISAISPQQFPPQNMSTGSHMLSPGNLQALQLSSSYLSRPQQLETATPAMLQQQQRQPQVQRFTPLVGHNLLGNANLQLGNHGTSNSSNLHYQLQQRQRQRQQFQQQPTMQRKMMAGGLGPSVGMGNMNAVQHRGWPLGLGNMSNLSSISNVVSMGALGGAMSTPMGGHVPMGLTNLGQINNINQVSGFGSFNQQVRAGVISHAQAAVLAKMRFAQNHGRQVMSGGAIRNPTDGVGGMTGNISLTQLTGGALLNQTIARGNMAQLQRSFMTSMGPPKVPAMSSYNISNQQQQQMQQLQLQQPQQLSSPLQQQIGSPLQQQEQQQMGSPLQQQQQSGLPEQVGSPIAYLSPQQMNQQVTVSAQQLSPGMGTQPMNAGNVGMGPGSPQLSSQTHGSVGSITSSPLEFQCVSKGGSVSTSLVGE